MTTTSIPLRVHPEARLPRQGRVRTFLRKLRILGLKGIVLVLFNRLTGRVSLVRFRLPGLPHAAYLRLGAGDFREYWRVFEDQELAFDLDSPRVIVDAGSRAGLSAAWWASRYPMATIYAVEMERSNFAVLDLNSAPYLNIVPVRAAIAGQVGKISIPGAAYDHVGVNLSDTPDGEQFVAGVTVGRFLDHYYVDRADVLKLTVDQKLEDEIFEDGPNWLERVEALILGARHESARSKAATARFPVRWQRGGTLLYAR
jgi:hypothetical protein